MPQRLFELLKNGDPTAIVKIHAKYSKSIFWIGKRWLDDEFMIKSLVQDVFLKLWQCRDRIERPEHMYFFLRFVMKRDCRSLYGKPRFMFYKNVNSIEQYENYQDYMLGEDAELNNEHLKDQARDQQRFEELKKVLPLLSDQKRHLIELCLKYGFNYKAIAIAMGNGVTETSNEIKKAIQELKTIIQHGTSLTLKENSTDPKETSLEVMTQTQEKIMELRFESKYSFVTIAELLNLSQEEVHKEFVAAYKLWQELQQQQSELA